MKIALVHHHLKETGGTENYTNNLALEYKQNGHQVYTLTSSKQPNSTYIKHLQLFGYTLPQKKSTQNTLKEIQPDIIHVQSPHPYATLFSIYAHLLNKHKKQKPFTIISTYHAPLNPNNKIKKLIAYFEHKLYKYLFQQIIVTTEKNKEIVKKFYPQNKITTIPLGISEQYFQNIKKHEARKKLNLAPEKKYVLFIGQLDKNHYYKGIETIIESAKLSPEIEYLIIGTGDKKEYYQKQNQSKNLQFIGHIATKELPFYYAAADIFILPSTSSSEGYGIVLLEAMASKTPVITTNCTGSSEEIKKNNAGIIIEPNKPEKLTQTIQELLKNPQKQTELINNGYNLANQKKWDNIAKKTFEVYNLIIGQR